MPTSSRTFHFSAVVTGADGGTVFEDRRVPMAATDFAPPAAPLDFAALGAASQLAVIGSNDTWRGDAFHPSPARQFMIVLTGRGFITVSDGETRAFGPGEVVLLEDTVGQGHSSRFAGETTVLVVRVGAQQ